MLRIGILGATGLVGRKMFEVLRERLDGFDPVFFGSPNKWGRKIEGIPVIPIGKENIPELDYALFAVSNEVSNKWIQSFARRGIRVIDNSSAFRMKRGIPLVVPEVNAHIIKKNDYIIANPNCSTIGMVMALHPIMKTYGIESVHISTYQAVSGAGEKGVNTYDAELAGIEYKGIFKRQILGNLIPFIGDIDESGFCREEKKTIEETHKILDSIFPVYPHVVRVPVKNVHSEALTIQLDRRADIGEISDLLSEAHGLKVSNRAISPLEVDERDEVFISRLRKHPENPRAVQLWVVFDNLRKGAATNAVQILEHMEEAR